MSSVVVDPGFKPFDFDHPSSEALPVRHTWDRVLVTHGGHVIGSRPFSGLRLGLVPVETPHGDIYLAPHQIAFCGDDVIDTILFISDRDMDGFAETDDVLAPFDRFKVGGERLPDPPAY